jgi:hypothetical protein
VVTANVHALLPFAPGAHARLQRLIETFNDNRQNRPRRRIVSTGFAPSRRTNRPLPRRIPCGRMQTSNRSRLVHPGLRHQCRAASQHRKMSHCPRSGSVRKRTGRRTSRQGVVELGRRAVLDESPRAASTRSIPHAHRLFRVVGHNDAGGPCLPDHCQRLITHAVAQTFVETGKRFVHQKDARPRHQGPRKRDTLLFAPGQRMRIVPSA